MSWSRYQPPATRALPTEHVDLFDRPAANGPHPWPFGPKVPDPAPALAAELAALREQAKVDGLAAALAEARAIAAAEIEKDRARWAAGLEALVRETLEVAEAHRRELGELAVLVAQAVLQAELDSGAAIEKLVAAGLQALAGAEGVVLALSPADAERTAEALQRRWPELTVRPDPALAPGGFRLDGPTGRLSSSIAARLAHARALVLGETLPEGAP
jgi:flagellar biosynthesis/type III secretory pathway protein FliH